MRRLLVIVSLLALGTIAAIHAQVTDPIPAHIEKRGLMVEVRELARLPDTRGLRPRSEERRVGKECRL